MKLEHLPLLLRAKQVMRITGFSRRTLRDVVAAGGLTVVNVPGLTQGRFLRVEIEKILTKGTK